LLEEAGQELAAPMASLTVSFHVAQVEGTDIVVVELSRQAGDYLSFIKIYKQLREI
jgi:hypothetical protein